MFSGLASFLHLQIYNIPDSSLTRYLIYMIAFSDRTLTTSSHFPFLELILASECKIIHKFNEVIVVSIVKKAMWRVLLGLPGI